MGSFFESTFGLQVVQFQPGRHIPTGDVDHARGSTGSQAIHQQVGELQRRNHIDRKIRFDPIPSQLARRGGPPGVVDQHIQARRQGLELCHQGIHIRQPGKISQQQRNRPAAADLPDLSYSSFTAGLAAPGDIDLRPHPSQRRRGLFANTAGAAGDQHSCLACFTFAEEYLSPVL